MPPPSSTKRAAHPGAAAIETMVRATRLGYPDPGNNQRKGCLSFAVVPVDEEDESPFVGLLRVEAA